MFFVIIPYRDVIEKYRSKALVSRIILNLTARSRCVALIVTIKRFAAKITEKLSFVFSADILIQAV